MILHYSDHAANERTFLAWVRTALAVIALGCLMEKLDLFLRLMFATHLPLASKDAGHWSLNAIAGMISVLAGVLLLVGALLRYYRVRTALLAEEPCSLPSTWLELGLSILLGALGIAVFAMFVMTLRVV